MADHGGTAAPPAPARPQTCVEREMAAGKTRAEAEAACRTESLDPAVAERVANLTEQQFSPAEQACIASKLRAKGGTPSDQDIAIAISECAPAKARSESKEGWQSVELRDVLEFKADATSFKDGLIKAVKVLGPDSANKDAAGRPISYTLEARRNAARLYENVAVNVDHPNRETPGAERSYRDRIGRLENVDAREDGTFADLRLNPRHPLYEQIAWDAQHSPGSLGLSHNAQGKGRPKGDRYFVEEIVNVRSVDVVADPATTKGLFESKQEEPVTQPASAEHLEVKATDYAMEAMAALRALAEGDMDEAAMRSELQRIAQKLMDQVAAKEEDTEEPKEEAVKESKQIAELTERIDRLESLRASEARRAARLAQVREARLPERAVSQLFFEDLMAAEDERAQKMIADRKAAFFSQRPTSRDPGAIPKEERTSDELVTYLQEARGH